MGWTAGLEAWQSMIQQFTASWEKSQGEEAEVAEFGEE